MQQFLKVAARAVKEAHWLTRERLLLAGSFCAFVTLGLFALDIAVAGTSGLTDAAGEYTGRDFFTFWSSAQLAAAGRPEAAYIIGPHHPLDHAMPYPPITMLLCCPRAGLSFAQGFFAWVGLGLVLCTWALSPLLSWEMAAFATIGTPAALMNVLLGQTGCYTAALLGSGMMFVERRPLFAGVLLGLISCKPQLGILVIVALAAGRHGRVLIVAAATAFVLALASTFLFGPHIWIDFLRRVVLQQHFIELHIAAWSWMPTVFAMVRLMTASSSAAYAFQGLSTVSAVIAVAALWRR